MAINNLTLIRRRIGDNGRLHNESLPLADTVTTVPLSFQNATITSLYDVTLQPTPLVLDSQYQFDSPSSIITLMYAPAPDSRLDAVYNYYTFTDDELNELITQYGVNGACLEAVRWLMADSAKLHSYSRGATSESLDQVFKQLKELFDQYSKLDGLGDPNNTGQTDTGLVFKKRTNQWYRGKRNLPSDISRDDI